MQSTSFTLYPTSSIALRRSLTHQHQIIGFKLHSRRRLSASFRHQSLTPSDDSVSGISASFLPQSWSLSPTTSTPFGRQLDRVVAKVASAPEAAGGKAGSSRWRPFKFGILVGLFYLSYNYFSIYGKQVLKVFHYPANVTLFQLAVGSVLVLFTWTFHLSKRPKLSPSQFLAILPLALAHTVTCLITNINLGKLSLMLPAVIALEPFLSAMLSAVSLGEMPTPGVVISLFLIVAGAVLVWEPLKYSQSSWSYWTAVAYILTYQFRNVLSKKLMVDKEESIDSNTLFSVITIMSFIILLPATFFMEGFKYAPSYLKSVAMNKLSIRQLLTSSGVNIRQLLSSSLLAALFFHAHQQVSYMILHRTSPLTHSVVKHMNRIVVVLSSVIIFKRQFLFLDPSPVGIFVALNGVFVYLVLTLSKAEEGRLLINIT